MNHRKKSSLMSAAILLVVILSAASCRSPSIQVQTLDESSTLTAAEQDSRPRIPVAETESDFPDSIADDGASEILPEETHEVSSLPESCRESVERSITEPAIVSSPLPESSEESIHVHSFHAQTVIVLEAWDESLTIVDKPEWDETIEIVDQEAWDEIITVTDQAPWEETVTVTDREAWDEVLTIIDEEAYDYVSDEIHGYRCRCGLFFSHADDGLDGSAAWESHHQSAWDETVRKWISLYPDGIPESLLVNYNAELAMHSGFTSSVEPVYTHVNAVTHEEVIHHDAVTHTEIIHHDAVTHEETIHHGALTYTETTHHPAESHFEIIHHDPVYETIFVCEVCGMIMDES